MGANNGKIQELCKSFRIDVIHTMMTCGCKINIIDQYLINSEMREAYVITCMQIAHFHLIRSISFHDYQIRGLQ